MVQVEVTEGVLEGEVIQSDYAGQFYSFKGIPYAEPPLGDLRFKAPQPPKSWQGVRPAKEFGSSCYQYDLMTKAGVFGTEDCLYLNVYTPDVKPDQPLPVMFFIHGGAFISGSGNDDFYGPDFLLRQKVVLVTINYRLEVLGFLCLDTPEVPGNAGMKDQVAALRWVKKNISYFGGDPDNVTIFGESAGGASVSFHLTSPMSKGLFKRAIPQSGVSISNWAQAYKPRERAFKLGRNLGLYTEDAEVLFKFLQKQPVESLITAQVPILLSEKAMSDINIYFSIVEEKDFKGQERFLAGNIYDVLSQGVHEGVDVMLGYTTDEGVVNLSGAASLEMKLDDMRNYLECAVPKIMALTLPMDDQLCVGRQIREYYFKKSYDWESLVNFYSASIFIFSIVQFAKFCAKKKSNVYLYKFSCKSERNVLAHVLGCGDIIGSKPVTCHADDLMYLFDAKRMEAKVDKSSKTFELIDRVTRIWTNFAKYGDPTPDETLGVKWAPYTLDQQNYLDIGNVLATGTAPDHHEMTFWEDIHRKYAPRCIVD